MKFKTNELPMSDFEILGFSKEDVINMSREHLTSLLKGTKTDIMTLGEGKGKLSLSREDGEVKLKVHPYRSTIDNSKYQLEEKLLKDLKDGKTFTKEIDSQKMIFQLDKSINEIVTFPLDKLPKSLSNEEKELLAAGKTISKSSEKGDTKLTLDLNSSNGINITGSNGYDRNNKLDMGTKMDFKY